VHQGTARPVPCPSKRRPASWTPAQRTGSGHEVADDGRDAIEGNAPLRKFAPTGAVTGSLRSECSPLSSADHRGLMTPWHAELVETTRKGGLSSSPQSARDAQGHCRDDGSVGGHERRPGRSRQTAWEPAVLRVRGASGRPVPGSAGQDVLSLRTPLASARLLLPVENQVSGTQRLHRARGPAPGRWRCTSAEAEPNRA
jgi:hypothetical protein